MPLPGTRLGPYEILGPIGAGGMGEVYRARDTRLNREVAVHRLTATSRPYTQPRVSPDGTRVVLAQGADSLWLHDLSRDARTPLTPGRLPGRELSRSGRATAAAWCIDASTISGGWTPTGPAAPVACRRSAPGDIPATMAPDGDTLAVLRTSEGTGGDVFALVARAARMPAAPLVQTPGYDGGADFSPDGRWLLYASTDSGPSQVYLSPYPALEPEVAGVHQRWHATTLEPLGREVIYREGNRMMAVGGGSVRRPTAQLETPRLLFEREFTSGGYITIANYDVLADGSFVMTEADPGSPRLTVVLNWLEALTRQMASPAAR